MTLVCPSCRYSGGPSNHPCGEEGFALAVGVPKYHKVLHTDTDGTRHVLSVERTACKVEPGMELEPGEWGGVPVVDGTPRIICMNCGKGFRIAPYRAERIEWVGGRQG